MNRTRALLAAILPASMLALSAPAFAQGQSDAGWYIGGSYGKTSYSLSGIPAGVSVDDGDTGFKIFGGFQFTKHWGAEAGYVDFGNATASGASLSGDVGVTAITFAGTGTLPLGENFALLGKLGLAMWDSSGSASSGDNGTDVYFGVGARYSFNKNLALVVDYERFDAEDDSVNMISVGVRYKF
jgi:OmpA-OmpF porin, OOP family